MFFIPLFLRYITRQVRFAAADIVRYRVGELRRRRKNASRYTRAVICVCFARDVSSSEYIELDSVASLSLLLSERADKSALNARRGLALDDSSSFLPRSE